MSFRQLLQQKKIHEQEIRLRSKKIKQKLKKAQKQKLNIDNDRKIGQIQKIKYIRKKKLDVIEQKQKKEPTTLLDNIQVTTFCQQSEKFKKILIRTENIIQFQIKKVQQTLQALIQYANQKHQKTIDVILRMQQSVQCSIRPFQINTPYPVMNINKNNQVIVICSLNDKQKQKSFGKIKDVNLIFMSLSQFLYKLNNKEQKNFVKKIKSKQSFVFCQFEIFKDKIANIQRVLSNGIIIFPIDCEKIPFSLRNLYFKFEDYFFDLTKKQYSIIKSGQQHMIRFVFYQKQHLCQNIITSIHQHVAKLIERNTQKGNKLIKAEIKTLSSSPLLIYSPQ